MISSSPGKGLGRSMIDTSSAAGIWYLNENYRGSQTFRVIVSITYDPAAGTYSGLLTNGQGVLEPLDCIQWDEATRLLEFRLHGPGFWRWYRGNVVEGILLGRYAQSTLSGQKPEQISAYNCHVTGWNSNYLDQDIAPRSYDLEIANQRFVRLRIDRAEDGSYVGRFKVYAGPDGEGLEQDVEVTHWDGAEISFTRYEGNDLQVFTGRVSGRELHGTYTQGSASLPWHGARVAVLGYGLVIKSEEERARWQERTRRQLYHLMMGGNPCPLTRSVTMHEIAVEAWPDWGRRDDNPDAWPQDYHLFEIFLNYTLPNPYGSPPLERRLHGYLALPGKVPVPGKHRAMLALNGHSGSAWKMMHRDADDRYWYGEGFARRGFVVFALDISHRPTRDHSDLYPRYENGDDARHGNGAHPAVKAEGLTSDWEESGERAWDAIRALEYLLTLPEVDPEAIMVTGLSMGGETSTIAMGLDTRFSLGILAGFAADLDVEFHHNNHPCWRWINAEVREFIDTSDFHALAAPRPLIVQTGKQDATYSDFIPPFVVDKQTVRRSRVAYAADNAKLVHHLHDDAHRYHVGDFDPSNPAARQGVWVPVIDGPQVSRSLDWQTDDTTRLYASTLFEVIDILLARKVK